MNREQKATPMRIIHLSDLHFGTQDAHIVQALHKTIQHIHPDMVVISGDFTQIANTREFEMAGAFLRALPCPFLAVPGNHDIPRYHLTQRFLTPYKKYKTFITPDLSPAFENGRVIMAGLNSARRALPHWNWANGAISEHQREYLRAIFTRPDDPRWKICVFHHPVHKADASPLDVTVFGRKRSLQTLQDLKVDLVLTGHVHHASITTRGDSSHQCVYLSASTALSSRTRGQENGFNLITLDDTTMRIEIFKRMDGHEFAPVQTYTARKPSYSSGV